MADGVNRVELLGNLGQDPILRYTESGKAVATLSLATNESYPDPQNPGKRVQAPPEWHRIVAWNKTAETVAEFKKKGDQILIHGKLKTRDWTDKDGIKRWTTEVHAQRIVFTGPASGNGDRPLDPDKDAMPTDMGEPISIPEDDIPF